MFVLNQRIKIYEKQSFKNAYGEQQKTQNILIAEVFARAKMLNSSEIIKQKSEFDALLLEFIIRFNANLKSDFFIEYKGKDYEIISILNLDEKQKYQKITAKALL